MNVSVLCDAVCSLFPQINRDLLVTAALLHDIGKLDAYEVRGAVFEQTEAGKLIGEPVLSERRLSAAIVEIPGFPPKYHLLLSHLVLSHHGEFEFGAPILPSSLEALVLHHVDNLEAKTNGVLSIMKKEEDPERVWSEYSRLLERSIYLPRLETEGDIREGD
ncbi:MAG: HD domain-containing protein [Armatimonadetes bacterium]|nr:HD domain-containing protein [Armatimonadota bacterium]NIO75152.1 HD domain-containing protein [Armatimonadota bacterium]NIO95776.1 HD domain-containing protein [Armatimonadota bacterium]